MPVRCIYKKIKAKLPYPAHSDLPERYIWGCIPSGDGLYMAPSHPWGELNYPLRSFWNRKKSKNRSKFFLGFLKMILLPPQNISQCFWLQSWPINNVFNAFVIIFNDFLMISCVFQKIYDAKCGGTWFSSVRFSELSPPTI